ncbi:MAG TPA: condensation domain-containing protein, partial [Ktedonobacteraceae bacterium]
MESFSRRIEELSPEQRTQLIQRLLKKEQRQTDAPVIRRREQDAEFYPLSFAQQRLWFMAQLQPGNPFYNISGMLHLEGPLQVTALHAALNEIVRRHEALRTVFGIRANTPVQVVVPVSHLPLPLVDLSSLPNDQHELFIKQLLRQETLKPFSFDGEPLLRFTLLRSNQTDHTLLLSMHHIISDIWSISLFEQELGQLYAAFHQKTPSPLPELSIQYIDFALWQRQWLQGERLAHLLEQEKLRLAGAPALVTLPTDRPRPAIQSYQGAIHYFSYPSELAQRLREFCQQEGITTFMLLMTAFHTLLHRYTGLEDIVVGSPIANRTYKEIEGLIGCFV